MVFQVETTAETKARRSPTGRPTELQRAQGSTVEVERLGKKQVSAKTVFVTGRECPLACSMCDLWKYTLPQSFHSTPPMAIADQVEHALRDGPNTEWLKIYNASNFFDPKAVSLEDYSRIAELSSKYERMVVENHPLFNNSHIASFQDQLRCKLEIAVGLESTNNAVLQLLNKGFDASTVRRVIRQWRGTGIDVRAFILVNPPTPYGSATAATYQSVCDAFEWGVRHVSLIPTRTHWGILRDWVEAGKYHPPTASDVESLLQRCLNLDCDPQSISVDIWDWGKVAGQCTTCSSIRRDRLQRWNEAGDIFEGTKCEFCQ